MSGITGIHAYNEIGRFNLINLQRSIDTLMHRGPDAQGSIINDRAGLGYRRLALNGILPEANRPTTDISGRYSIVFDGEIINASQIRNELAGMGVSFIVNSDPDILLNSFIQYGINCLEKLNGSFAFAIYDREKDELFLARDRLGIKPLLYYHDEDRLLFASELGSMIVLGVEKSINWNALYIYFQLGYIPAPLSIINGINKLLPGHYIISRQKKIDVIRYYKIQVIESTKSDQKQFHWPGIREKIEKSVERSLVPGTSLGVILNGNINSAILTGLASGYSGNLKTFSMGYHDANSNNEIKYARLAAGHFKTDHHEFLYSGADFNDHLNSFLDLVDEPFADPSAVPAFALAREIKKHAAIALLAAGADEIFAGTDLYRAFNKSFKPGITESILSGTGLLWKIFSVFSKNPFLDKAIGMSIYRDGLRMDPLVRYWLWTSITETGNTDSLLAENTISRIDQPAIFELKKQWLARIGNNLESVIDADHEFRLTNKLLYRVDYTSMAQGLAVRMPFLSQDLVEFMNRIPLHVKFTGNRATGLTGAIFKDLLPPGLKEGHCEATGNPMKSWSRSAFRQMLNDKFLENTFLKEQGIFHPEMVESIKRKSMAGSPERSRALLWAIIVFQWWWKKRFS